MSQVHIGRPSFIGLRGAFISPLPDPRNSNWVLGNSQFRDHCSTGANYTLPAMQKLFSMFPRAARYPPFFWLIWGIALPCFSRLA